MKNCRKKITFLEVINNHWTVTIFIAISDRRISEKKYKILMIPRKSFKFLILFLRMNCEGNIFKCVRRFYVKFHFKLMKITISKVFKPFKKSKYFMRFVRTRWTRDSLLVELCFNKTKNFKISLQHQLAPTMSDPKIIHNLWCVHITCTIERQPKSQSFHKFSQNSIHANPSQHHRNASAAKKLVCGLTRFPRRVFAFEILKNYKVNWFKS